MIAIAFMIGLAGSLHCLGMCGPIAFALPVRTANTWIKFYKYLLYNSGRVFTYGMLGLVVGMAGKGLAMAGLQEIISVGTGVMIIVSVLVIYFPFKIHFISLVFHPAKEKLKSAFHFYFQKTGLASLLMLGVLNGLLPCGMVYMAMMGALTTGNAFSGAMFMIAFGLGTVPMMLIISLSGSLLNMKWRSLFNKATPVLACILAALLIMRGLNMRLTTAGSGKACCHAQQSH